MRGVTKHECLVAKALIFLLIPSNFFFAADCLLYCRVEQLWLDWADQHLGRALLPRRVVDCSDASLDHVLELFTEASRTFLQEVILSN